MAWETLLIAGLAYHGVDDRQREWLRCLNDVLRCTAICFTHCDIRKFVPQGVSKMILSVPVSVGEVVDKVTILEIIRADFRCG